MVVARAKEVGGTGGGGQRVQTSSSTMVKFWGSNDEWDGDNN